MSIVVDASTVVAALIDDGPDGRWAEEQLRSGRVVAPHLLPVEVGHVLRRAESVETVGKDSAALAFAALVRLPIELAPFEPLAERIWELRSNLTIYDAFYVALAESIDAPLATLDLRLAHAPGTRCDFITP
ncbi:MAG: type II toxin-antitoxin system VapC family toxin [Ilumatobacter sp.]|uniref:type II toxin-antitoxin system VapC family toxin n=1 Tax=Ilumatobacter sp. TaxID=1967498 RepID=UPI0032999A34